MRLPPTRRIRVSTGTSLFAERRMPDALILIITTVIYITLSQQT